MYIYILPRLTLYIHVRATNIFDIKILGRSPYRQQIHRHLLLLLYSRAPPDCGADSTCKLQVFYLSNSFLSEALGPYCRNGDRNGLVSVFPLETEIILVKDMKKF